MPRARGRWRWTAPAVVLGVGIAVAAVVLSAGALPDMTRAGSVARLPIPSTLDVELEAKRYTLSFGTLNAPRGVGLHLPRLRIDIVPPPGLDDPDFLEDHSPGTFDNPGGESVRRVAYVRPHVSARYHLAVSSPDENGGALLVGDIPPPDPRPARLHAALVLAAAVLLALGIAILQRRRVRARA